jgi:Spy/CpxP family protein refolding chaperone
MLGSWWLLPSLPMEDAMSSMARRTAIVAAVFFGAGAAVGCGGAPAGIRFPATVASAPTSAPASARAAADVMESYRRHHGGVTLLIAMSLATLGVSPEQRAAVERIRTALYAGMDAAHAAEQRLLSTLAEGLAAANLEAAKVDADVARVVAAFASVHDESAETLNQLHALLTPSQRAALVDEVESHWVVWQHANVEETGAANTNDSYVAALAADLGLTREQVDKFRAGLGAGRRAVMRLDPKVIATHLRAFGGAFRSEKFDGRGLTSASGANAHLVGWGAARMALFVEALSPVLAPDQRAKLAQRLRAHAAHNPSADGAP